MSFLVAGGAAEFEFVDDCSSALFVVGGVVVLQEVGAAAVDAVPVTLLHDPLLAGGGVALPS